MSAQFPALSRASFLKRSATIGTGLGIALYVPACAPKSDVALAPSPGASFAPNVWVRVSPDDFVTVVLNKSEMGQGVLTGLPSILGDELDANMDRLRTEFAPAEKAYVDPVFGDMITGGSTSIADGWMPLRQAGAAARAMLVAAAAKQWSVDPSSCSTKTGVVTHGASGRTATYGSLADAAGALPVPKDVPLKSPDRFTVIGKHRNRPDIPLKVNGTAGYGIDVKIPGMVYGAIARSPVFGGKVRSFNDKKALAIPGVIKVAQVSNGVAVVAKNTWAAFQGKLALEIVWDEGAAANVSTASLFADAEHLAKTRAGEKIALTRGKPDTTAGTVLEATYRGPLLAHATMEPMNTTAHVTADACEVWSPNQVQLRSQAIASQMSGLPLEKCTIHTTFLGGGFGRRLEDDYVGEAVEVSKTFGMPVKVTWTREDDIQHDCYRPMSLNVVRGVVANGKIAALTHQVVSKSWMQRWWPAAFKNGIDGLALTEVIDAPYAIENFKVTYINHDHAVTAGSFRAPDANWNGFVTESFMDELAHAAGKDPLAFRLEHLGKSPRAAGVLKLAAEKAGWGKPLPEGRAQGIAMTFWGGSYAAMVVTVSMDGAKPVVHKIVAAVDCGTVVNPDIVLQQAQGATNFGLSAALTGKITIDKGRVMQNNFYDYTVLRMQEAAPIEVHVVSSTEKPTGVGEICTPPVGPAIGNAIFKLTGKRYRSLPFSDGIA